MQVGVAHAAGHHFDQYLSTATGSDTMQARLAQMETRQADGKLAPGPSAIGLCRGAKAFAEGDYSVSILEPLVAELPRIGGSHAQRELWEDTLVVACLRAAYGDKAKRLISDRLRRRPSTRDAAWSREAERYVSRA
jgi:hypothetical protein